MIVDIKDPDVSTDSIDLSVVEESGQTQTCDTLEGAHRLLRTDRDEAEANIIVIAHPDGKRLGSRFRLRPGEQLIFGRSIDVDVSMPEVLSLSRRHARLRHRGPRVTLRDLGSTNGTYVNGGLIVGESPLESGDRFQVASVHFKFLHEMDVEHAYYEAIHHLVTRDGLTDIYNKRKFDEEVARELARAQRHQRPLSLVLIDIDNFKQVNDTYGHLCGDFVLKEFTNRVRDKLRPEQIFARLGGDEFVILAPETQADGALTLAEKICAALAETAVRYADIDVEVNCSCGVAELGEDLNTPTLLYEAADRALYAAKAAGRNRVSVHTPD